VTSERTSRSTSPTPDARPDVVLEPFAQRHLEATFEWLHDEDLRARIDSLGAPTRATHESYWQRRLADVRDESYAVLADGVHVGNGGLLLDPARRKAELWLYLGDRRGRGIGRKAVDRLLRRAFDELGLNRVGVRVVATNDGALRFWRSVGFTEEGRAREDTWVNDLPVDAVFFSLLARERGR
jgi:RimJ/RimL family protein N-acetyltransferase